MNIAIKIKKYITDFCSDMIDIYLIIIVLQKLHYFFCMKYEGKSRKNKLFNNFNLLYIFQN